MIQNNSLSSETKSNQNEINHIDVKKICYQTALVGLLGRLRNSSSYSKLILCYSLPDVTPHNKFHPNWMKNAKFKFSKFLTPKIFLKIPPKLNYRSQNLLHGLIGSGIMKIIYGVSFIRGLVLPNKWFNFLKRPQGKIGKPRFSPKIKKSNQ